MIIIGIFSYWTNLIEKLAEMSHRIVRIVCYGTNYKSRLIDISAGNLSILNVQNIGTYSTFPLMNHTIK